MFDLIQRSREVVANVGRRDVNARGSKQIDRRRVALVRSAPAVEVIPAGRVGGLDRQSRLQCDEAELRATAGIRASLREVALFRAADAVRSSRLELACRSEAVRLMTIQKTVASLAESFADRIDDLERRLRDRLPPEILEALKQRIFEEMTASVNRISRYGERAGKEPQ